MSYYRVTLTYRVDAASEEEAIEAALDLVYEDVEPMSTEAVKE